MENYDNESVTFVAWPEIKGLHNVLTSLEKSAAAEKLLGQPIMPLHIAFTKPLLYRGKVKLHGQNGGVTIEAGGRVGAQSRNTFLDKGTGLGEYVHHNRAYFADLFRPHADQSYTRLSVFGEWCGARVQKGVALSMLAKPIFAVFAIQMDDAILYEPEDLTAFLTHNNTLPDEMHVLPWHTEAMEFNLADTAHVESRLDTVNGLTDAIDSEDPWVLRTFGVRGPGEGLVWYPINVDLATDDEPSAKGLKMKAVSGEVYASFVFKTKGEKHRVVGTKKAAQVKAPTAENASKYVELMLPEPRLQQGVQSVGGMEKKHIAAFIKWVVADVEKEGKDELAASGLEWKQVAPLITTKAREWFLAQSSK
ncbi:phenylalanyl-tRNA synthetase beta subunit, putative [Acanthamoeba castellanii str. Neff]|uniref:Phenylalanyl-tRNA synthetase beta subunit, putative n=1 Tax=Acanthamoeba castellanii (strain ATCC 30010 / Neff) TaxID=1257118 RepID=L8GVF6_ACACF|nr:phenylalanyl-tRNA synthetase beta subunit, putative [Acanthamoeba castellanii str. Neff]ELR17194.1 phenylalanyl-tRNA synthetase beta subunit, putative [Acanthamoeba castellanii str. Neff]